MTQDRKGLKEIAVGGIMLRKSGKYVIVEAEVNGKWKEVIREHEEGSFSHIVEPEGIKKAKPSALLTG